MSKKPVDDSAAIDKLSTGAHLGGTNFGQTADAKTKDTKPGGDKARLNDGTK